MKAVLLIVFFVPTFLFSQFGDPTVKPSSWNITTPKSSVLWKEITVDNAYIEKIIQTYSHGAHVAAVAVDVNFSFNDFTLSKILQNGDKIFQLKIISKNAEGMSFFFDNFKLSNNAKMWVYDDAETNFKGVYTSKENRADGKFSTSTVHGETVIIEYLEPKDELTQNFKLNKIYHFFNSLKSGNGTNAGFKQSKYCEVNAKCSESANYSAELTSTCRILVYGYNFAGFCSGTLVNNTRQDRSPLILTANHCSNNSSISDLVDWEFQFNYQSPNCFTPTNEPTGVIFKGSTALAYTGTDGGDYSSDFLLLKLTSSIPESLGLNFLGWDRSGSLAASGLCFHHPAGDIKKISMFNNKLESGSYGGNVSGTHFVVNWSRTTNGYGVTEGGSSGSGLLNSNGQLIGTLTGGTSDCGGSVLDMYGKLYYHWDKNGNTSDIRVKDWLDPDNTGANSVKSTTASASISTTINKEALKTYKENENLVVTWSSEPFTLNMYDIKGTSLFAFTKESEIIEIPMHSIPKGIYLIEAISNNQRMVQKIEW